MREILFRAKRKDNGAWETGSLVFERMGTSEERVYIADKMTAYHTPVFPQTVGEFTGLTDKNGVKIFEGDILRSFAANKKVISAVKIGAFKPDFFYDFAHERGYDMSVKVYGLYAHVTSDGDDIMLAADMKLASIIGNIYDNPELLRGDNDD